MSEQKEQFEAFLRGDKPLCVIEKRKCPDTFQDAIYTAMRRGDGSPYHAHIWSAPEGAEVVLARDFIKIAHYISLLHMPWGSDAARKQHQIELGIMFGYDEASCREFADNWTPEFCQCSKCVGVHKANAEVF